MYLDANERRWYIPADVVHLVDRHETQATIIQPLADWLKEADSLSKVYNWFMSYSLDGFNPKSVPDSDGLARLIDKSKSPHAEFLEGHVAENKVFTYADLKDGFKTAGYTPPSDAALRHLLAEVG